MARVDENTQINKSPNLQRFASLNISFKVKHYFKKNKLQLSHSHDVENVLLDLHIFLKQ